jgi:MFS family permease
LIAVGCATAAASLMSFVMTAAPLAMVMHHHHQNDAVLGIQWHVLAMFGPSFFTGSLIVRFGPERIVAAGLLILVACALVGLAGTSVGHFWLSLILLGLGWNFAFIGATTMLTHTYRPEEKEKVQALNDFLIFGIVAIASFLSGEILLNGGWDAVNLVVLPFACACLLALFWQLRRRPDTA